MTLGVRASSLEALGHSTSEITIHELLFGGFSQGALAQARRALRPDGLLLAALLGGDTLQELRIACSLAEQEREGGVSSRISPMAQVNLVAYNIFDG